MTEISGKSFFLLVFLLSISFTSLSIMGNNNKQENKTKLDKQDDYAKTWLAIVIPVSIAVFGCSEYFFGMIRKLYKDKNITLPICIVLVALSMFCFGTALWINQDNIRKDGNIASEKETFMRKSRWNTAGTVFFFLSIAIATLFFIFRWFL